MNPWLPWDSVLESLFPSILSYVEDADVMAEIPNPFLLSPCPTVSAWDLQATANGHTAKVVSDALPQMGSPGLMSLHSCRQWRVRQANFYFVKTTIQTGMRAESIGVCQKFYFCHFTQNDGKINPQ